jgi:hypothetical protein
MRAWRSGAESRPAWLQSRSTSVSGACFCVCTMRFPACGSAWKMDSGSPETADPERLENGFPGVGVANPFADLAGDSDKMRQGRVAVVPHACGAVAVPGCRPGKWYETDALRN